MVLPGKREHSTADGFELALVVVPPTHVHDNEIALMFLSQEVDYLYDQIQISILHQ